MTTAPLRSGGTAAGPYDDEPPLTRELRPTGPRYTTQPQHVGVDLPRGYTMSEVDPQGFAMIPRWLLYDESVTPAAKLTYAVLAGHSDRYGVCWPSHPTLARLTGLSISSVQRSVRELVSLGVLVKRSRRRASGARSTNEYVVAVSTPVDRPVENDDNRSH